MSALPQLSAPTTGGRLVSVDGRALPFRGGALRVEAAAGLSRVVLRQRFVNPHAEPLRVTYTVPVPADASVSGFAFELGSVRVVGEVDTKQQARARFEEAMVEGRTAALLEQERSSVFTQEVGNIPPGGEVTCELVLDQPLAWQRGGWSWRFPTVVAPRFAGEAGRVPDADKVAVEVAEGGTPARMTLSVSVADPLTGAAHSPSHPIHVVSGEVTEIGLAAEAGAALDRDIVVSWPVAAPTPGARIVLGRDQQAEAAGLITLVPPAQAAAAVPRDLVVLLDTSGSMGGAPLAQARAVTIALIESLGAQDQLQLIEFSTRPRAWNEAPVAATAEARARAVAWVAALRAGGGTEMRTGILAALDTLRDEAQRQVVLITDGLISFEKQITAAILHKLPRGCRVHTLGIGSSVNRTLLTSAARAGGGTEVIVGIDEDPAEAAAELVAATAAPQVVDVSLSGDALCAVAHHRISDLMAGRPARIAARLRAEGGTLVVAGHTAAGPWQQVLAIPPTPAGSGSPAVVKLVGRERVAELELRAAVGESVDAEITALGLRYQIATRLTSWIAVTQSETVDAAAPTRAETVPQALPYGMSAEGLGLRSPTPPSGALRSFLASPAVQAGAQAIPAPAPRSVARRTRRRLGRGEKELKKKSEGMRRPSAPTGGDQPQELASDAFSAGSAPIDFDDDESEAEVEVTDAAPAPIRAPVAISGRVVLAKDGRLTVELTVSEALEWALPAAVLLLLSDGQRLTAAVDVKRTTHPGRAAAGLRLRLTITRAGIEALVGDLSGMAVTLPGGLQLTVTL